MKQVTADWNDESKLIVLTYGIDEIPITPADAEGLIDRLRSILDEHPEE
jgi:hypothetical protein